MDDDIWVLYVENYRSQHADDNHYSLNVKYDFGQAQEQRYSWNVNNFFFILQMKPLCV